MKTLFRFIVKYQFVILFLVLETFSFWLLSRHTYYQKSKIESVTISFSGYTNEKISNVRNYFRLKTTNETLAQENLELRKQLAILAQKNEVLNDLQREIVVDSLYRYTPAKIINNSVNKRYNYLTLNKGSNAGIEPEMGVISQNGIIGIIVGVSPNYSTVISLLNIDLKLSAKLSKSNHFGSLYWEGGNYREVTLNDIPQHVPIAIGDTVSTSGFSSIFPENVPIGVISSFTAKGSNFYRIRVKLFKDFKGLYNVWIVSNEHKQELLQLEER